MGSSSFELHRLPAVDRVLAWVVAAAAGMALSMGFKTVLLAEPFPVRRSLRPGRGCPGPEFDDRGPARSGCRLACLRWNRRRDSPWRIAFERGLGLINRRSSPCDGSLAIPSEPARPTGPEPATRCSTLAPWPWFARGSDQQGDRQAHQGQAGEAGGGQQGNGSVHGGLRQARNLEQFLRPGAVPP